MKGRLLILIASAVLLIVSLIGIFAARALPDQVEQETTLLNYEHEGRFDYLVYLKPSHLFGPPPQEPPPNPKYLAEIVDTIDFTFSYSPAEPTSEVAHVDAVLENPDIWHKKIKLVPYTSTDGDFKLRFSLDIEEISELFDDIEEEIKITSSPRHLTINAYVTAPKEGFVHSLPIKLSKTLIEVDANLRHTQACGVGAFDYVVNLKENSIFDTRTLEPPPVPVVSSSATAGPEQVVFTKLVDKMDVTFYYSFKSDRPASRITTDVEITALLKATRGEDVELWSKKFPILYTRKNGDFNIGFPLDLVSYLELLETIRAETGASGESNNVIVTAIVHTVAETPFGLIDETFSYAMTGILKGNVLEWDEELAQSQSGSITTTQVIANPNRYLGLSVAEAGILSSALAGIFSLFFLLSVAMYVRFRPAELSRIEKEVLRVRKKYGKRIAEMMGHTPIESEKRISLGSMEDMIKVADELLKPIVHQAPSNPQEPHAYYVIDGATLYEYLLATYTREQGSDVGKNE